jgi:hypothetical protein
MRASIDLAERAGIGAGLSGIDLCCCNGAGMRFLVRFRNVASMVGVDATERIVDKVFAGVYIAVRGVDNIFSAPTF